jgi:hypothetical protein
MPSHAADFESIDHPPYNDASKYTARDICLGVCWRRSWKAVLLFSVTAPHVGIRKITVNSMQSLGSLKEWVCLEALIAKSDSMLSHIHHLLYTLEGAICVGLLLGNYRPSSTKVVEDNIDHKEELDEGKIREGLEVKRSEDAFREVWGLGAVAWKPSGRLRLIDLDVILRRLPVARRTITTTLCWLPVGTITILRGSAQLQTFHPWNAVPSNVIVGVLHWFHWVLVWCPPSIRPLLKVST